MKRLFVYLIYSDNNHLVPLFKLFMSELGTESRYRRRYLFDSLSIPLLNVLLDASITTGGFSPSRYCFAIADCQKIMLASIKRRRNRKSLEAPGSDGFG